MCAAIRKKMANMPAAPREIVNLKDRVYVATGYDLSIMSMISGPEGVIVVDSGADPKIASALWAEFRKISDKALRAVIFTHSHPDHIGGAAGILGMERELNPSFDPAALEIWSRANWGTEFLLEKILRQGFLGRLARQAGMKLSPEQKGQTPPVVPFPDPSRDWPVAREPVRPNRQFGEAVKTLNIAGIELEMHAAPGETDDHLFLWLPGEKILFTGDNIFCSFPNLYAARGTQYRDVAAWIQSLKAMYDLHPDMMVMGHSAPLHTSAECDAWLGDHHEAVSYVYEQTIAGMNQGKGPDELAESVRLPERLASKIYLTEFYGCVAWSVKGIFTGHFGWFDGNARKLAPLTLLEEARRMADMAGSEDRLLERAAKALEAEDNAWAAQLADYLLRLDSANARARTILADALENMAAEMQPQTGRFYMLSQARELRNQGDDTGKEASAQRA